MAVKLMHFKGFKLAGGVTKEYILAIEAQQRANKFPLVIKSYLFEGIFVDAKGVNCVSLEFLHANKYQT